MTRDFDSSAYDPAYEPTDPRGYADDPAAWADDEWLYADTSVNEFANEFGNEFGDADELYPERTSPSLPIILFSAAGGVAGGIISFFISYRWLQWGMEISAGIATLGLLFSLGISGAILSSLTGSRAAPVNILFSCGLLLLAIFFLALCLLVGAIVGTLLFRL